MTASSKCSTSSATKGPISVTWNLGGYLHTMGFTADDKSVYPRDGDQTAVGKFDPVQKKVCITHKAICLGPSMYLTIQRYIGKWVAIDNECDLGPRESMQQQSTETDDYKFCCTDVPWDY
jgi:hypothetical protein